jgi:ubiquinone/menaquinone biosynthesis C-methylase UbiE
MMKQDSTQRFSNRVSNYVKYRPSYPAEVINYVSKKCCLDKGTKIADVGSGTGIFSELLLDKGYTVYGVEPNKDMRLSAEEQFKDNKSFISVNGTAEDTCLNERSIDLVVCAQAFHWFDPVKTAKEFKRILKDDLKYIALIWNNRLTQNDEFAKAYDQLLDDKGLDYKEVNHQHLKGVNFEDFYKDGKYTLTKFPNQQIFDYDGLAGRAFSSSYVPAQDTVAGLEFAKLLKAIFDKFQSNNRVVVKYETEVYLGRL